MKPYKFLQQEDKFLCLPACLQMVLDRNSLEFDSQIKILEECGNNIRKINTIDNFFRLKQYPLHCLDFIFTRSFCRDFDELTKEALNLDCDILVGYAYENLYNTLKKADHVSILKNYNKKTKPNTTLIDPAVDPDGVVYCNFDELIKSMFTADDGFHIIHKDKNLLERLRNKYH